MIITLVAPTELTAVGIDDVVYAHADDKDGPLTRMVINEIRQTRDGWELYVTPEGAASSRRKVLRYKDGETVDRSADVDMSYMRGVVADHLPYGLKVIPGAGCSDYLVAGET